MEREDFIRTVAPTEHMPTDEGLRANVVAMALHWARMTKTTPAAELTARARLLAAAQALEVHRT